MHDGRGPKARSMAFTVRAAAALPTNELSHWARNLVMRVSGQVRVDLRLGLSRVADRAWLTDVRSRAAVSAVEQERARLSQDLHDDSLQALARVIHRLEARSDTVDECQILRNVAANLRDIATELHPPALADLGVVPAIESIGTGDQSVVVTSSVLQAGYERAARPPQEVEVVVFRIVQEAVANAVAHSGCRMVRIEGHVRHGDVAVDVIDDGRGLSSGQINAAQRSGHIGVASMRRRAAIINADLTFRSSTGSGTTVSLRWRA